MHRRQRAALVERHQHRARLLDRVVDREVPGGAPHRADPLALDMDQPDPRLLEPAQDLLGLLGARRRGRTRPALDSMSADIASLRQAHDGVVDTLERLKDARAEMERSHAAQSDVRSWVTQTPACASGGITPDAARRP